MTLRHLLSEEVQGNLQGYLGVQKFMRLYFSLPNFIWYVGEFPLAEDTLVHIKKELQIETNGTMTIDDFVRTIAREWTSPLMSDETRRITNSNLDVIADHILKLASEAECTSVM